MRNDSGIKIIHSARFLKSARKLPEPVLKKAGTRDALFRKNPFDPQLRTHKLHGPLDGFYAYSVDHRYRIIFSFQNDTTIIYHEMGPIASTARNNVRQKIGK